MKRFLLTAIILLSVWSLALAQEKILLLDDYEGPINGGPGGTVDFGAGNGSTVEVGADTYIKASGNQSLKVEYIAMPGGYIWVSRGYGLNAKNSSWLVKPEDINWQQYKSFSFYVYGNGGGETIAFDICDNGGEIFRYLVKDRAKGWTRVVCPFAEFNQRNDWQPTTAIKNNILDFPISSYQYEPRESQGALHFDKVELIEKE